MSSDSTLIHTLQLVLRVARLLARHLCGFRVNWDLKKVESRSFSGCESGKSGLGRLRAASSCLLLVATALKSEPVEVSRDGRDPWKEGFVRRSLCGIKGILGGFRWCLLARRPTGCRRTVVVAAVLGSIVHRPPFELGLSEWWPQGWRRQGSRPS